MNLGSEVKPAKKKLGKWVVGDNAYTLFLCKDLFGDHVVIKVKDWKTGENQRITCRSGKKSNYEAWAFKELLDIMATTDDDFYSFTKT